MTAPMVRLEDVHKTFPTGSGIRALLRRGGPGVEILRGVSFEVSPGGRTALLGANGVGKTTVLKAIAGLLQADRGRVELFGRDVSRARRYPRGVTYVLADERSFSWRLTARENLEFFAALNHLPGREVQPRIHYLLERLDLAAAADVGFWKFSTGMKQRLAIARALLTRPRVLLMDEPTRSIDATHAAEVWRLVRDEMDQGDGCLILVTHQLQEALSLCDRVAILADGQIALETPTDALHFYTADLDGFTLTVRGLTSEAMAAGQCFPGIRELRLCAEIGDDQVLELWVGDNSFALGDFLDAFTSAGAVICSLQRTTPLQAVLQRLLAPAGERSTAGAVA